MFTQGKVVYANYGRREDLENLQNQGMNLAENIALVRTGNISLAEKVPQISLIQLCGSSPPLWPRCPDRFWLLLVQVANAARFGLAAVLIYREPNGERENTELYGQVSVQVFSCHLPVVCSSISLRLFLLGLSFKSRFTSELEILTLRDFLPSTTPSFLHLNPLGFLRSWLRPSLRKQLAKSISKFHATDCIILRRVTTCL